MQRERKSSSGHEHPSLLPRFGNQHICILQGSFRDLAGWSDGHKDGGHGWPSWPGWGALMLYLATLRNAKPGFQVGLSTVLLALPLCPHYYATRARISPARTH